MTDCSKCGHGPLGYRNRSGLCRNCCIKLSRAGVAIPMERNCRGCGKPFRMCRTGFCLTCHNQRISNDPVVKAARAASNARWAAANPQAVLARSQKATDTRLAWCPKYLRDEYRYLLRAKRLTAAEARAVILETHRANLQRMSPFERQEAAWLNGAKLIANDQRPSLGAPADFGERRWG